jgi:IS4 transposase
MLNVWDSTGAFFVVRHKDNLKYERVRERDLPPIGKQHVLIDEEINLSNKLSKEKYPKTLRRVVVWDDENEQVIELITNNFKWSADTIGQLYKARWTIEIFFRDLKQLLHIKTFIGTSENAVKIQIWTALITILLLKVLKNIAKHKWYLSNLVSFIRLNLFVKIELQKWLDNPFQKPPDIAKYGVQGV